MPQEAIEAPITVAVISIEASVGDKVEEGDVLLYIESMKLGNPILAPVAWYRYRNQGGRTAGSRNRKPAGDDRVLSGGTSDCSQSQNDLGCRE